MEGMPQPGTATPKRSRLSRTNAGPWSTTVRGQAPHCRQEPSYTGRWYSPRHYGTYWRVWACEAHTEGLTGLRECGRRRE
jgi:hypothetical protein